MKKVFVVEFNMTNINYEKQHVGEFCRKPPLFCSCGTLDIFELLKYLRAPEAPGAFLNLRHFQSCEPQKNA